MKLVILAGGVGSRLSEETYLKPKPMVEVGGTVGDIESLPFLEAIRQMRIELGAERSYHAKDKTRRPVPKTGSSVPQLKTVF